MTLSLDDIIFRTRALAQTHPFTSRAQAYHNSTVARERTEQPAPDMGIWASYSMTAGYCLRRVEEEDDGRTGTWSPLPGQKVETQDLEELSSQVADQIRTDQAGGLLLYPEPLLIDALDRLIGGEIERRLSDIAENVDSDTFGELEAYIGWWVLKGYSLRVAEQLAGAV